MKHEKSCGAIIVCKFENSFKVLLIKHVNGGHWSYPKGHMEGNETETETALREIKEETGLCVTIDTGFRQVITYSPKKDVTKDVVYFIAVPSGDKITTQVEEVEKAGWFSFEEAKSIITYENDIKFLDMAKDYIMNSKSEVF